MDKKISISGMFPQEITEALSLNPSFRGKQVFQWIAKGASDFEVMTNLDKSTREKLSASACIYSTTLKQTLRDPDGTIKLQIELDDGRDIETVLLTDREGRKTACVSCQAGCAMGCAFCMTGTLGLGRNLTAGEIVEEFLLMEKTAGTLDNIVFMGMGEPMQNLPAIRKAVEILSSKEGRNLSTRRITVSTCGLIKGIYDLADNGPHVRLAVSLTTADPELRESLMPVSKGNPLHELKKAISYYIEKTGKRVTLEAALMSGRNTTPESARRMIDFAKGLDVYINLIPWNPVKNLPFATPSASECQAFASQLENAGLNVNLRTRRGTSIGGACGQLGSSVKKNT
ncbi:MAG TPA: 23S rRNA (adenine(2503)-C(2))-methyltransferase RlmN [Treponema sp.]|jgi:23S rRNA (adenine2503-C2)-methyltransferase|nr:23S rRNA (adenine(2503)-C(2))-methyltransferase RlmN [Treponema sp.]HBB43403.1 23S rRNA (adenine(2503)-C(2))-methyltransferase RlmN [Treponema sp.]HCA20266.1 23S rRNA (adenine(2503)-C(2))-methyltransferase RlmN [Treponema sp.]